MDIEGREVPVTKDLLYMDPKKAMDMVDENTIGICAILGSTVSFPNICLCRVCFANFFFCKNSILVTMKMLKLSVIY